MEDYWLDFYLKNMYIRFSNSIFNENFAFVLLFFEEIIPA